MPVGVRSSEGLGLIVVAETENLWKLGPQPGNNQDANWKANEE